MISQTLYQALRMCVDVVQPGDSKIKEELGQFVKPYILVIHQPSGRGFYLNRQYRHIVDVSNCQEPESPTEVARHHLCPSGDPSGDPPAWVGIIEDGLNQTDHFNNFDTFWLY